MVCHNIYICVVFHVAFILNNIIPINNDKLVKSKTKLRV